MRSCGLLVLVACSDPPPIPPDAACVPVVSSAPGASCTSVLSTAEWFAGIVTATGDFDGDGLADLAIAREQLVVAHGRGDVTFHPPTSVSSTLHTHLAAADLDRDGRTDLIADGTVFLARDDGFDARSISSARVVAVHDIDIDGALDLIMAEDGSSIIEVHLGDGDGAFSTTRFVNAVHGTRTVAVADIDHDNILDLVVGSDVEVAWLPGHGGGVFYAPRQIDLGGQHLQASDLDEDGNTDLCSVGSSGDLGCRFGDGRGGFGRALEISDEYTHAFVIADLDGDHHVDLAYTHASDVVIRRGAGDGTFPDRVAYRVGPASSLAAADLDGSCEPELLVGDNTGTQVMRNQGGLFSARREYPLDGVDSIPQPLWVTRHDAVRATDLDRDGRVDVLVGNTDGRPGRPGADTGGGTVRIHLGREDATLSDGVDHRVASGCAPLPCSEIGIDVADMNGDGMVDLVANGGSDDAAGTLSLGNGDGTFQLATALPVSGYALGQALGDVDGDGDIDIVLGKGAVVAEHIRVLHNDGSGTFAAPVPYRIAALAASPVSMLVADLNGDGRGDVVVQNGVSGTLAVLLANANGGLDPAIEYGGAGADSGFILGGSIAAGDLDRDGDLDIVMSTAGRPPGYIPSSWLFRGNGDGTLSPRESIADLAVLGHVVLHDMDGDLVVDVVITRSSSPAYESSTVFVARGVGDGTFLPSRRYATASEAVSAAIADVTGDGRVDLVTAGRVVSVHEGLCAP